MKLLTYGTINIIKVEILIISIVEAKTLSELTSSLFLIFMAILTHRLKNTTAAMTHIIKKTTISKPPISL